MDEKIVSVFQGDETGLDQFADDRNNAAVLDVGSSEVFFLTAPRIDSQDLTLECDPSRTISLPLSAVFKSESSSAEQLSEIITNDGSKIILSGGQLGSRYTLLAPSNYIVTTPVSGAHFVDNIFEDISQIRFTSDGTQVVEDVQSSQQETGGFPKKRREEKISKPIGKGPYRCHICQREFGLWMTLKKHLKSHRDDRKYRCQFCTESFNLQKNFTLHAATHLTEDFVCPECGRKFNRMASFKSHLVIHQEEDSLTCPNCEQEFSNETHLNEHLEENHSRLGEDQNVKVQSPPDDVQMLQDQTTLLHVETGKKFLCRKCSQLFASEAELAEHETKHAIFRNLTKSKQKRGRPQAVKRGHRNKCKFCDKTFKKPSQCLRHERIHTGDKPFKCTQCPRDFNQKNALDIHMRKHTGFKPHICEFCKISFTQRGNLRAHVIRVHNPESDVPKSEKFDCEECCCSFKKLGSLNAHVSKFHLPKDKTAGEEEPCENEDLLSRVISSTGLAKDPIRNELTSSEDIKGHIVLADKDSNGRVRKHLVKIRMADNIKYHLCNFCNKEYKKPSDLCRHLRVHTLEKPFSCKLCSRSFSVKSALKVHLRIHNSNRVHVCSVCDARFVNAGILNAHKRRHVANVAEKSFSCTQCDKIFKTDSVLKSHLESHHKGLSSKSNNSLPQLEPLIVTQDGLVAAYSREKAVHQPSRLEQASRPYRCSSCQASFKKSSHLKQHETRHTGAKPFSCDLCSKSFTTRGSLSVHVKSHGNDQLFQCSQCMATFTTASSVRRHLASHSNEKNVLCPVCKKAFKTVAHCKKHIKIHANATQIVEDRPASPSSSVVPVSTIPEGTTDLPFEVLFSNPSSTYFTADSSGTVTLPLRQTGDVIAEISTDGTIDFKQNEFNLDTIVQMSEQDNPIVERNPTIDTNCPTESVKVGNLKPGPSNAKTISCTWDNCDCVFGDIENLIEHLQKSHSTTRAEISRSKKNLSSDTKTLSTTRETSLSEKVLLKSMSEKDKISQIKTVQDLSHDEPKFANQCEQCPKSFKKPSDLVRHIRTHTGEKPYACEICDKRFTVKSTLNTHKRVHEAHAASIKCHVCSALFASATALKAHMRLHTGAKPFLCPHCDERFRTSGQRKTHINQHHGSNNGTESNTNLIPLTIPASSMTQALDAVRSTGGPLLGATVRLQLNGSGLENAIAQLQVDEVLLQQLDRGENIQIVLNPLDTQATASTTLPADSKHDSLIEMSKVDESSNNEKLSNETSPSDRDIEKQPFHIFFCPWCDKDFHSESESFSHLYSAHGVQVEGSESDTTDDRACPKCKKVFPKPSQLVRHMRIHTGEKPFVCVLCLKAFNQKNTLQIHLKKHSGERPFVCPFCSYAFTQKGNLKTHIQRSHAEQTFQYLETTSNDEVAL